MRTHMAISMLVMMVTAAAHERVETAPVEACPLRGASERDQGDVRKLAWPVRIEAQSHVKVFLSTANRSDDAPVQGSGGQPRRK